MTSFSKGLLLLRTVLWSTKNKFLKVLSRLIFGNTHSSQIYKVFLKYVGNRGHEYKQFSLSNLCSKVACVPENEHET